MSYQDAFKKVEETEEYLIDTLRKLIAVDTSVPPGESYEQLIDVVEPEFAKLGFATRRVTLPDDRVAQMPWDLSGPRINLVADLELDKPKATAYAHMDVVPIDEPWTHDPFGGELIDGKLYGRGTVDMKGSIACFLGAMKVLTEMGISRNAWTPNAANDSRSVVAPSGNGWALSQRVTRPARSSPRR